MKSYLRYTAAILFNVVLYFFIVKWFLNNIDLDLLYEKLKDLPVLATLLACIANFLTLCTYGLRMSYMLHRPLLQSIGISILGHGLNGVLPFRTGELAKLYFANKIFHASPGRLVVISVLEKLLDVSALMLLALFSITLLLEVIPDLDTNVIFIVYTMVVLIVLALIVFVRQTKREDSPVRQIPVLGKICDLIHDSIVDHSYSRIMLSTALIWLCNLLVVYVFFNFVPDVTAFGMDDALLLLVVISLSLSLPAAPSGLGVFEAAVVAFLLTRFNIDNETAFVLALSLHISIMTPQVLSMLGIIGISNMRQIYRQQRK